MNTYNLSVCSCLGLPSSRLLSDPVDPTISDRKHSSLTGGSQPRKITLGWTFHIVHCDMYLYLHKPNIYSLIWSGQVIPIKPFYNPQSFLEHLLIVCWWDGSYGDVLRVGLPVVLFQCLTCYMILNKYMCVQLTEYMYV